MGTSPIIKDVRTIGDRYSAAKEGLYKNWSTIRKRHIMYNEKTFPFYQSLPTLDRSIVALPIFIYVMVDFGIVVCLLVAVVCLTIEIVVLANWL